MDINLIEVEYDKKEVLRNLLEKGYYEFSQYSGSELNDLGLIGFKWLDLFWLENGWHAYFIKVNNKLAGHVLLTDVCDRTYNNKYQIWDLFIVYKYRRFGVGTNVMNKIFEKHKGKYLLCRHIKNTGAVKFWNKIIGDITKENYEVINSPIQEDSECVIFDIV